MEWTEIHDTLLCREVLLEEPYKYKKGSNEKGKKWSEIAEALNKNQEVKFKVTQRGVRERMERLQKKYLEKKKEEESASGIAVDDLTELETLIDEIIEEEKLAEEARDSEGTLKKIEADKQTYHASYTLYYSDNNNAQVKAILIFRLTILTSVSGGLGEGPTLLRPTPLS